jgi:cation diffusion facilitator family transporter
MSPSAKNFLTPKRLLMASVIVAIVTITLKTLAWYLTDSVGLLSDAMESLVNLASAVFGLVMVTIAARPADEDHPYGHHKAEYFSSGFEGILIIAAAMGIVWTAGHRFFDPQPLQQVGWGLALSVVSSGLNGLLAWVMFRAAKEHRSIACGGGHYLGAVHRLVVAGPGGGHRCGAQHSARRFSPDVALLAGSHG